MFMKIIWDRGIIIECKLDLVRFDIQPQLHLNTL